MILPVLALGACAAAAPAAAQSRDEVLLSRVIQKLDLGTVSLLLDEAPAPDRSTFADYGYSNVAFEDGRATVTGPERAWTWTLRALDEPGSEPAICMRVFRDSRQYLQGAWRMSEDADGYLRAARLNSAACPTIVATGQRTRRPRGFVIPDPRGPEALPRFIPAPGAPLTPLPRFPDPP